MVTVTDWYVQIGEDRVAHLRKVGALPIEVVSTDALVLVHGWAELTTEGLLE